MKQGSSSYSLTGPLDTEKPANKSQEFNYLAIDDNETIQLSLNALKVPSWKKSWIDPMLKSALFPEVSESNGSELNTFFLLDAAQVTALEGVFSIDRAEELGVKPLLSGEPQKELKNYAPYLINLNLTSEQIESDQVPSFHKELLAKYWGNNCGIFLQSHADLETLARHCKKFIKLKDENDCWYFFRYYDPRVAKDYFRWMATDKTRVAKWFGIQQGKPLISSIVIETNQGCGFQKIVPQHYEQLNDHGSIALSKMELKWMKQSRWLRIKNAIYEELKLELVEEPYAISEISRDLIENWCEEALRLGYMTERAIYDFVFSQTLAHHFDLNLSEVNQYLAAKDDADLEKAKELHQILINAINTYRMNQKEE
ncbi:MAG: DUF4123 domain-containing protein [Kangiella sp.]|nr:DUF4123 domain-containing protein [Kangiella sp.]